MTIAERPYFLTNEEWFDYDDEEGKYILTEKAPPDAVKSYNEFYATLRSAIIID